MDLAHVERQKGRTPQLNHFHRNDCLRRILVIAGHPGEGPLTEPTATACPRQRGRRRHRNRCLLSSGGQESGCSGFSRFFDESMTIRSTALSKSSRVPGA
jgi:hypothetical protein